MLIEVPELRIKKSGELLIRHTHMYLPNPGLVLLRGKNGSGKTTLMKEIFHSQCGLFSMVCQECDQVLSEISVLDNIDMFQNNKSEIEHCLKSNGLAHLMEKPARSLSGGESRLLSVLRALFSPKEFILLDEPTNDIDDRTFEIIKNLIKDFSAQKTILIVSHDKRFDDINLSYEIVQKELLLVSGGVSDTGVELRNSIEGSTMLSDFERNRHNPVILFYCLLMFAILLYSFMIGVSADPIDPYSKYPMNTFRIASMIGTDLMSFNDVDAMNTVLLRAALRFNKVDYIIKASKDPKEIGQQIVLKEEMTNKVFPLEYYDPVSRKYFNLERLMTSILAEKLNIPATDIIFRKSLSETVSISDQKEKQAMIPHGMQQKELEKILSPYGYRLKESDTPGSLYLFDFSIALYNEALKLADGKSKFLVDALIVKNADVSFIEFLEGNGLTKRAYMIQGYEIYKAFEEANRFLQWYQTIRSLVGYLGLSFVCLILILYLFEKSRWKKYRILYYYGYPIEVIVTGFYDTYWIKNLNPFLAMLSIISGIGLLVVYNNFFVIAAVAIYSVAVGISSKFACSAVRKKIWKGKL